MTTTPSHDSDHAPLAQASDDPFNAPISQTDPQIAALLNAELERQQEGLEMIASENFVPRAVLQAQGSVLTNKYAEGYPERRYYGGCEVVDQVEKLAQDRVKALYHAPYANVQPHSGAQANAAVYQALIKPGDTVLGLALDHGGHLTHGMRINFSGRFYHAESYGVNPETYRIDPDIIRQRALETHPQLIIGGWSAYPRVEDFKAMKEIADEVGAKFWVDMAHFAGLVAAGLHPSPVPYADVVSSTAHKTLGGPRSGFILAQEEYGKKINSAVFPGQQGGPLMHIIAGKAVAFALAGTDAFKDRMQRTLDGAKILAERLNAHDVTANGITLLTGGTDVHLVMVDLRHSELDGKQGENLLAQCGITINRNTVPFDPRPASVASGLRIGTAALATRGFAEEQYREVADIIGIALAQGTAADTDALRARVTKLTEDFPLYPGLDHVD
ncbi:serine hydroxymethyltransferase [Bifidobacterium mongoliense]|uniref:serine hydroxymethyltransferase n=1 Tax=Bifidobacterium mongoliense TaxID=518643 RepID=UPI002648F3F8|nr:serine hydroxymethyltransferase [Bifidobacterium mongoliense]MDN6025097.1 serine hydroxymethyltransferase [Bifidobacterium mongoliense]MDN6051347.1 serine hydroxymethyltransferase [Bifidobacterium mongoliense]MDN6719969.1 serine hydroxymethyltransferase [Bifidobacterium mongoliense]